MMLIKVKMARTLRDLMISKMNWVYHNSPMTKMTIAFSMSISQISFGKGRGERLRSKNT